MSDLARLPSYPSPTTLIARSGIQFLDFGFDPTKLRVREWGFHDAAASSSVDDLVQLDFDEGRGQYEVVESGRRRAAQPNLVVTAKDALAPFLDKWVPVPFLQVRPPGRFRHAPADWARIRIVELEQARRGLPRRAKLALPRRARLRHRPDRRGRGSCLSRPVVQGRHRRRPVRAGPPAARQPLAAAPGLDEPVARGVSARSIRAPPPTRSTTTSSRSRRKPLRAISPSSACSPRRSTSRRSSWSAMLSGPAAARSRSI